MDVECVAVSFGRRALDTLIVHVGSFRPYIANLGSQEKTCKSIQKHRQMCSRADVVCHKSIDETVRADGYSPIQVHFNDLDAHCAASIGVWGTWAGVAAESRDGPPPGQFGLCAYRYMHDEHCP